MKHLIANSWTLFSLAIILLAIGLEWRIIGVIVIGIGFLMAAVVKGVIFIDNP
jgi:hypothetical protein